MQLFHRWPAVFLMEMEALFGRHSLRPRRFVVPVNFTRTLQYEAALLREVRRHLYKIAASMRQTLRDNDLEPPRQLGQITRQRVRWLTRGPGRAMIG